MNGDFLYFRVYGKERAYGREKAAVGNDLRRTEGGGRGSGLARLRGEADSRLDL